MRKFPRLLGTQEISLVLGQLAHISSEEISSVDELLAAYISSEETSLVSGAVFDLKTIYVASEEISAVAGNTGNFLSARPAYCIYIK